MLALVVILGAGFALHSNVLKEYQTARLTSFLAENVSTKNDPALAQAKYNVDQSKTAIGAGGSLGEGLFEGSQTRLGNVPEQHTDFIFTAVGEQLGFAGAGTLLALFCIIVWRIWRTAQLARDEFGMLVCVGVLVMLMFQIFENVGMTMGIMPVTGIPLPVRLLRRIVDHRRVRRHRARPQRPHAAVCLIPTSLDDVMTSIWPQLEALLPRVAKPARYIGCEHGAQAPEHQPGLVSWLLTYPDTYEIGLPNQGLQILYEILNERPDAVAERAYAPWTDLEALLREHVVCRCSRSTPIGPRASSTSSPSTCRPSSSTRTS